MNISTGRRKSLADIPGGQKGELVRELQTISQKGQKPHFISVHGHFRKTNLHVLELLNIEEKQKKQRSVTRSQGHAASNRERLFTSEDI